MSFSTNPQAAPNYAVRLPNHIIIINAVELNSNMGENLINK